MKPFEIAKSIQFYGSIVLRIPATPVEKVNDETRLLIKEMSRIMRTFGAAGLAANQVGIIKRVILIDRQSGGYDGPDYLAMVNPEILQESDEKETRAEGCLSIPTAWIQITRNKNTRVKYLDEQGKEQILDAEGLTARVIQHEIDHLNAKLIIDY